jgi:hypothetical protein
VLGVEKSLTIGPAWELKKDSAPGATRPEIEALFDHVSLHVHGAKIMSADGGGLCY